VQALELLLTHEAAPARMDVQMPNMIGFDPAELMRGSDRTRTKPLIFLTAATHEREVHFRGYEVRAADIMYKAHGGRGLATSAAPAGTVFEIVTPRARGDAPAAV
jgi:CheY-like chemotaxis protein